MTTLYKYITLAIVAAALFVAALLWHDKQVDALVLETQTTMANQYNSRLIALQNTADASSLALQKQLKDIQDAKQNEIADINKRHASIVASLQNRPNRPTSSVNTGGSTSVSPTPQGNTGLQLYRGDAEFLAWFSRDTSELQAELNTCLKSYSEVKDAIETFKRDNPVRLDVTPVN